MLARSKPWEAIGFYRAALALRPQTSSVYYNLGLAQVAVGDWEEARESYRQAVAIDPNLAAVRTHLGDLLAAHVEAGACLGSLERRNGDRHRAEPRSARVSWLRRASSEYSVKCLPRHV